MTPVRKLCTRTVLIGLAIVALAAFGWHCAQVQAEPPANSYAPVVMQEDFDKTVARMSAAKPEIMERQMKLLEERYDLSDRPAQGVTMSRGKPIQEGVRAKLPAGVKSWEDLAAMTPEEIREKGLWPKGFLPLPHPNHPEGGMVFPKHQIDEVKKQEGRDLTRFDLDFDLPDASPARVSAGHLPDDAARPGRRVAGPGGHAGQLLQAVQRPLESEAIGRAAAAGDALPAAAVQRHRRSAVAEAEHRRDLLRLPRQRAHQRHDAPGRRHPPAGVPPSPRHAVAARA